MINFHDFNHQNKDKKDLILGFVNKLKKYELIYLDEFQVTNIVDAMILEEASKKYLKKKILVLHQAIRQLMIYIKTAYKES